MMMVRLRSGNAFTILPRATSHLRMSVDYTIKEVLSRKWCDKAKVTEEHRVALACHDNSKEFIGYINKHKPCAPLGPVFSTGWALVGQWMRRWPENSINTLAVFSLLQMNIPDPVIVHAGENTLTDIDCAEPEFEAKLKPDKAAGSDGLPKVLKPVADDVVPHLCQIFDHGRCVSRL